MSTKTLRKRIALVAVSAMGFGLLTSVAANAAIGDISSYASSKGNSGVLTAATDSVTGQIVLGGWVSLTAAGDAGTHYTLVKVTGGKLSGYGAETVSADGTMLWQAAANTAVNFKATPTTAGTNMVVKTYDDGTASDQVVSATDLKKTWTYNVLASGKSGVFSAGDSYFNLSDSGTATYAATDTQYANVVANGNEGRINIKLYDGLGTALTTDQEVVTASVKSGDCLVGGSGAETLKFYSVTTSSGQGAVYTAQNTTDAPTTCVVEISVNGAVVATKTITHQGKVSKVSVTDVEIAASGSGAQTGLANVVAYDAAGNSLGGIVLAQGTGANDKVSTITFSDGASKTASASTTVNLASTTHSAAANSTPTSIGWTCSGIKGSATMTIKYTPANGVAIHSAPFTASCFGDAVNYKASFDKPSYIPGDIATLTITATDSAGNPANDQTVIGTNGTKDVSIAGSNLTAVTAPTNADTFTSGKKTYKYIVGSTEGSYSASVDLPKFNSATYSQTAQTVAYSIKASSASVTNADVLAAIVKLIASINKQIAALQKAIMKK